MYRFTLLMLGALFVAADNPPGKLNLAAPPPPAVKTVPHERTVHGDASTDPYFWMKDKTNPEMLANLEAETAYAQAVTLPLAPLREQLYKEFLGRIKQTDLSVPYTKHGYSYFSRTEEGKQYAVRLRKKLPDGPDEVLLDPNQMLGSSKFLSAFVGAFSDDDQLLAYLEDRTGYREYSLFIKDLRTGKLIDETPIRKVSSVAWAADNKTLFYVVDDHAKRPYLLMRYVLGSDHSDIVYEEKDELYRLAVARSHDEKMIFVTSNCATASEARFVPANSPNAPLKVLLPRESEHEYYVNHRHGQFVIRTNKGAKNFRIVTAPVDSPSKWTDILPHDPAILREGITLFDEFATVSEREAGRQFFRIVTFNPSSATAVQTSHRLEMPEPVYSISPSDNPEFASKKFRFQYQSYTTPSTIYDCDMATRQLTLLKRTEVLGGYDPAKYRSEWITATAGDGTKIPISLVWKLGVPRDGTAPCLLSGYGAYGSSGVIAFSPVSVSLLDRGLVVAQAHIRGGRDLGQAWHEQGRMLHKKNTFTDFIACADHLVANKYCSRDRLAIRGGSAGGLLIGAVVNMRPDLCKVAVAQVPFMDVINTMMDPNLPLTVQEYLEWGNPNVKAEYEYMKSYDPYGNLSAKVYPSMLVTSSLNDSQVMVHEPAKYVAKLRTLKTDKNPLIFRCNMAGGHGGSSGRYDALKESAFDLAFVLNQIGAAN